jgi:hypothetical protein
VNGRFVPVPRDHVHTIPVDGEAVLLDEASGRLHLLNATGALVWACFDGYSSIGDIVSDISDELLVPRDVVLADTVAISRHVADEGLLANVDPVGNQPVVTTPVVTIRFETSPEAPTDPPDPRCLPEPPNP